MFHPCTWLRSLGGSLNNFQLTLKNCDLDLVFYYFVFFVLDDDFNLDLIFIIFVLHLFDLYFHLGKDCLTSCCFCNDKVIYLIFNLYLYS